MSTLIPIFATEKFAQFDGACSCVEVVFAATFDMTPKPPTPENAPSGEASDLNRAIDALAREVMTHPGFMRTEFGFEVLHADWPAYPRGHGVEFCLHSLAEYPRDTKFFPIDNIDRCTLFAVGEKPKKDPFNSQYLHVAVWDEDIRQCQAEGFVDGVKTDDEFLLFPDGYLQLTTKGVTAVLIDLLLGFAPKVLDARILEFLRDGQFDTAVRESSIVVETRLRGLSGLSDYGRRLVEKCFGDGGRLVPIGTSNADRLFVLNAFSGYFKYVRNEYAHNVARIDMLTATTLVRRSAFLLTTIDAIASRLQPGKEA